MCSKPASPAPPAAPPPPTPARDESIAAREKQQDYVRRGAASGYASTLTSNQENIGSGGTSPVLGGA